MQTSLALPSYSSQLKLRASPSHILVKQHMTQKSEHHRNKSAASPIIISTICTVASTKWGWGWGRGWILFVFFFSIFLSLFLFFIYSTHSKYISCLYSIFSILLQNSIVMLMIFDYFLTTFFDYASIKYHFSLHTFA